MSEFELPSVEADAIVIGGGFYGAVIASYLASERGLSRVMLFEAEDQLMQRASYANQARVHNGYHYPRSFTTAYRSRVNLPRFMSEWAPAVQTDFTKLYAIARRNSKATSAQFVRFCQSIGAAVQPATPELSSLFNPQLVERVFLTEEYGFDTRAIRALLQTRLQASGVHVALRHKVEEITPQSNGIDVAVANSSSQAHFIARARHVFNCTYAGLNTIRGPHGGTEAQLKHEITEMALVDLPPTLEGIGITVMDGPFFSIMPFPARGASTLSHVRYTPHKSWMDSPSRDPYAELSAYSRDSRYDRMIRDVARYVPAVQGARYRDSLFEVKTVLVKNEGDDGRPILFETYPAIPGFHSVLGGKLDNIYDVISHLDNSTLE